MIAYWYVKERPLLPILSIRSLTLQIICFLFLILVEMNMILLNIPNWNNKESQTNYNYSLYKQLDINFKNNLMAFY
jgi:hypothetical protein